MIQHTYRTILIAVLGILLLAGVVYIAVFGRALRQDEDHAAILFAIPRVLLDSEVARIGGEKYFVKDTRAFIKEMERQGYVHIEQMGAGHVFSKDSDRHMAVGRMYSSYFMVFTHPEPIADREGALSYFIEAVTAKVKTTITNYDKLGLGGGVDGFNLVKTYPGLQPSDFTNVTAYQGGYSAENNELFFTGNGASNSAVIEREGMRTLLGNIAKRLGLPADTKSDINRLLIALEQ